MKNPTCKNFKKAFSLVEIVVAMTILALISTTVLSIVSQAGATAADLRESDQKDDAMNLFLHLLQRTIETIPEGATIEMMPASDTVTGFPEILMTDVVGAFTFGEDFGASGDLYIGLVPQQEYLGESVEGSLFHLAISHESFGPQDTAGDGFVIGAGAEGDLQADSQGRYWLTLVDDVVSWGWRYRSEDGQDWLDEWSEVPALMELVIEDSHRPGPTRIVFDLPDHLVEAGGGSNQTQQQDAEQQTEQPENEADAGANGGGGIRGGGARGGGGGGNRGSAPRG